MTTIRELKKDAKVRLSGIYFNLIVMFLIYNIIFYAFAFFLVFTKSNIMKIFCALVGIVLSFPLSYGFSSCLMDNIRGKLTSVTEFINVGFKNLIKVWKLSIRLFLKLIIPIFLNFCATAFSMVSFFSFAFTGELTYLFPIASILFILSIIFLIIKYIHYSFCFYILKDKPEKSSKEILVMSRDLMKGNVLKYIGLELSFIGWFFLIFIIYSILLYFLPKSAVSFILFLGPLLLYPYIFATMIGFYEDLLYDKSNSLGKENS